MFDTVEDAPLTILWLDTIFLLKESMETYLFGPESDALLAPEGLQCSRSDTQGRSHPHVAFENEFHVLKSSQQTLDRT